MEMLFLLIKNWREIAIGIVVLACLAVLWHIRYTYKLVDTQRQQIEALTKEVQDAKHAIKLQNDIASAQGRIDQKTYSSVRAIIDRPVPVVLVPAGVYTTVPSH